MADTELSLRDALSGAFDKVEAEPTPTAEPVAATPEPAAPVESGSAAAPAGAESESERAARVRDEKGRFASKAAPPKPGVDSTTGPPAAAAVTATPLAVPAAQPVSSTQEALKPPQSLKPLAREKWASVPQEVQAEFVRRERETAVALQEASEAKRFRDSFKEAVAPYEAMLRAEGAEPLAAFQNLLQTSAALRTAPPGHKAKLVANIIRTFGVPIDALDAELTGQAQPQGAQAFDADAFARQVEERVSQRFMSQQQDATRARGAADVQSFVASQPEFFQDVRATMADLIELASRRGKTLSLQDAYERAIRDEAEHPDIAQILKQRDAQKAVANVQASTQRARAAASSVRSQPAVPSSGAQPSTLREQLEQAFSEASGR